MELKFGNIADRLGIHGLLIVPYGIEIIRAIFELASFVFF